MGQQLTSHLMAGIIDQLQEKATRDENEGIAIAAKRASWANTFNSYTPDDKLRENLNLTTAIDNAIRRKQELMAREDLKAQELLHREKKFEQWQADAPLRTELLQRKVASEGAHEAFVQRKDAEAMADVAGFFDAVSRIGAKPGTSEYQAGLNAALQRHPRVIGTQVGADALKRLQQEHVDIAGLTPPPGQRFARTEFGEDGRAKAIFEPIPEMAPIPDNFVPTGATQGKSGTSVQYGPPRAERDTVLPSLERERGGHQSAFDRASQRRIQAQRAYDKALLSKNADLIELNKDLVKAADADIKAAKQSLADVDGQIRTHREGAAKDAAQPAGNTSPTQPPAATPATNPQTGPLKVSSRADYDGLPSGAEFIDPQGVRRRKP